MLDEVRTLDPLDGARKLRPAGCGQDHGLPGPGWNLVMPEQIQYLRTIQLRPKPRKSDHLDGARTLYHLVKTDTRDLLVEAKT